MWAVIDGDGSIVYRSTFLVKVENFVRQVQGAGHLKVQFIPKNVARRPKKEAAVV